MSTAKNWIPEIMYEESADGVAGNFPFIQVPDGEVMPQILFIWEFSDSGDVEPGPNGEEVPIMNAEMRQFARMDVLKDNLSTEDYDKVRRALGLEKLATATKKGQKISEKVKSNIEASDKPRGSLEN